MEVSVSSRRLVVGTRSRSFFGSDSKAPRSATWELGSDSEEFIHGGYLLATVYNGRQATPPFLFAELANHPASAGYVQHPGRCVIKEAFLPRRSGLPVLRPKWSCP